MTALRIEDAPVLSVRLHLRAFVTEREEAFFFQLYPANHNFMKG